MAGIEEYLDQIQNAIYGRDVRQAIHDGIEACYEDGKVGVTDLIARERIDQVDTVLTKRIDELISPSGEAPSAAEVTDAREGADGVVYDTLGTANRTQFNNMKTDLIYRFNAINAISAGYYVYGKSDSPSKGFLRKSTNYHATDFIPVYEGMSFCVTGTGFGNVSLCFAYDSNHAVIDNLLWETDGGIYKRYTRYILTIPAGVSFVRFTFSVENNRTYSLYTDIDGIEYIKNFKKVDGSWTKLYTEDMAVGQMRGGQSETYLSPINPDSSTAPYRLTTNQIIGLPFGKHTKIKIKMKNSNYVVAFRFGQYANHMSYASSYYHDGDTVDVSVATGAEYLAGGANYFMATVGFPIYQATPGNTDSTAKKMLVSDYDDIGLELYAINDDSNIIDSEVCNTLASARLSDIIYGTDSHRKTTDDVAMLFHTSDPHGDEHRIKRFLESADNLGADLAVITGDIVTYNTYSGFGFFHKLVNDHEGEVAICTGNHDVYIPSQTDDEVYAAMFAPIATKLGISTGKTYYYKDFADKKLRVISVNLYQYDGQSDVSSRPKTHFTAEQITWLVNALSSTPSGYGVVILEHSPQRSVLNAGDAEYPEFFQPSANRPWDMTGSNVDGAPIYDIVDAFIGRTSISATYTQQGTPSSITVSADFSSVPSNVEFIAYMSGHIHMDSVCYIPNTAHKQLCLNVIGTTPAYGGEYYSYLADGADIGRESVGMAQDAFNAYVIDRTAKTVKVVRIGADTTYQNNGKRQYMEIPYTE